MLLKMLRVDEYMYLEGLLERLNNEHLKDPDNEGRKVLDGTVCEYLEHYDNHFIDLFVLHSTGKYLDLIGQMYGIIRRDDESDTSYRNRIYTEMSILQCIPDLLNVGVRLWVYDEHIPAEEDYLTSENPYIKESDDYLYLAHADENIKKYIQDKFILEDLYWF